MRVNLGKPYIKTDVVLEELKKVIDSRWISGGPTITAFENALKEYNNDPDGRYIAVSNGTVALELSLLMLNNGNRYTLEDEIITTSWSWVATGFVVPQVGATPVWADVDPLGVTDPDDVESKISDKTKAIIIVHQMGMPADLTRFNEISEKYGIPIIEDAACAVGSEYQRQRIGKSQNIVTYSFQARKVLTTGGEGGMIIVRDEEQEKWLRSFRAFGTNSQPYLRTQTTGIMKEYFDKIGGNYKLSDVASAFGIAHLKYIDEEIDLRRQAGEYYHKKLEPLALKYDVEIQDFLPIDCTRYNWQNYHVVLPEKYDRDTVVAKLKERGVGAKWDIQAIHREPVFNKDGEPEDLPNTDRFHFCGMWLPFYAEITREEQDYVIEQLAEVLEELS